MLKAKSKFWVLFLNGMVILLLTCQAKRENPAELQQKVFEDIFVELLNETFRDYRKIPIPPRPLTDSLKKAFNIVKKRHQQYLDTTQFEPLHVIVFDTLKVWPIEMLKNSSSGNRKYDLDTINSTGEFVIDLSKIVLPPDYVLRYRSEFQEDIYNYIRNENFKFSHDNRNLRKFSGTLGLSRVYFNESKDYGVLNVQFVCGKLCGCSFKIWVRKVDNNWIIEEVENLGCA